MCKIRHSMTEGSQLFSFKTIMKCCLLPKASLAKSEECACTNFLPSVDRKRTWWVANRRKSWQIETPFFRFVKRAARLSWNRMWRHFLLDDPDTKISVVFCPTPGLSRWNTVSHVWYYLKPGFTQIAICHQTCFRMTVTNGYSGVYLVILIFCYHLHGHTLGCHPQTLG